MTTYCYCETPEKEPSMLQCSSCKNFFHPGCLKRGLPSSLEGDVFFHLTCANCGPDEVCHRMKLQWLQVVALALYNLQLQGTGKCGFFRWKEHICAFITKHWTVFFGHDRRKTQTWYGTVAGTLSAGCPQFFRSGTHILKENGWWALAQNKAPSLDMLAMVKIARRQSLEAEARHQAHSTVVEGLRKREAKTTLQLAIELRAKRDGIQKKPGAKQAAAQKIPQDQQLPEAAAAASFTTVSSDPAMMTMMMSSDSVMTSPDLGTLTDSSALASPPDVSPSQTITSVAHLETEASQMSWMSSSEHSCSSHSTSHGLLSQPEDMVVNESLPEFLMKGDEEEEASDLEIDPCAMSPALDTSIDPSEESGLPSVTSILDSIHADDTQQDQEMVGKLPASTGEMHDKTLSPHHIKSEPFESFTPDFTDSVTMTTTSQEPMATGQSGLHQGGFHDDSDSDSEAEGSALASSRKRKMAAVTVKEETMEPAKPRMAPMSIHEEKQLLKTLESLHNVGDSTVRRLRAKLRLRQVKRQRGLPLFDLDSCVCGASSPARKIHSGNAQDYPMSGSARQYSVLDRYQIGGGRSGQSLTSMTFMNRLVGTEDDQLQPVCSPYTSRMLKVFIRRDRESRPLKMKLLAEIQAYPHRGDPTWNPEPPPPIDYCYVRPQHIPSVNALCRQFFWPTIDVSECLQYPDFSCVVLYRKFVIGFAFMVPDVKYNEAYISFLFTHPEWRGAGIATFMIYHLLQTCMGKDVTLHVSANNPAMMLYQKFGFKIQQLILDFYEKYFPEESTQCRHACFLRLSR